MAFFEAPPGHNQSKVKKVQSAFERCCWLLLAWPCCNLCFLPLPFVAFRANLKSFWLRNNYCTLLLFITSHNWNLSYKVVLRIPVLRSFFRAQMTKLRICHLSSNKTRVTWNPMNAGDLTVRKYPPPKNRNNASLILVDSRCSLPYFGSFHFFPHSKKDRCWTAHTFCSSSQYGSLSEATIGYRCGHGFSPSKLAENKPHKDSLNVLVPPVNFALIGSPNAKSRCTYRRKGGLMTWALPEKQRQKSQKSENSEDSEDSHADHAGNVQRHWCKVLPASCPGHDNVVPPNPPTKDLSFCKLLGHSAEQGDWEVERTSERTGIGLEQATLRVVLPWEPMQREAKPKTYTKFFYM